MGVADRRAASPPSTAPLLHAAGSAREVGLARGRAQPALIGQAVAMATQVVRDRATIEPLLEDVRRALEHAFPQVLEEVVGVAAAAGLDPHDTLVLSVASDLTGRLPGWCSLVALDGPQGSVVAKNLDTKLAFRAVQVVERIARVGSLPFVHVTTAGALWTDGGVNAAGLALVNASLQASTPNRSGLPDGIAARELLASCRTVDEATAFLRSHAPRTMGESVLVADAHGAAAVIEWLPSAVAVRSGLPLWACNNPHDPALAPLIDPADPVAEDSRARTRELEEQLALIATAAAPPVDAVVTAISLLARVKRRGQAGLHTIASLALDPTRRTLRLSSQSPSVTGAWSVHSVEGEHERGSGAHRPHATPSRRT